MAELAELLADVDEEVREAILASLKSKDEEVSMARSEATAKERALQLKTDDEMLKKYPRAVTLIRQGKLQDPGDDEALAAKEAEYESAGVPDPLQVKEAISTQTPESAAEGWGAAQEAGAVAPPMDIGTRMDEAQAKGDTLSIVQLMHIAKEEGKQAFLEQRARQTVDETWPPILSGGCVPVR